MADSSSLATPSSLLSILAFLCLFSQVLHNVPCALEELDFVIDTAYLMVDAKKISICAE